MSRALLAFSLLLFVSAAVAQAAPQPNSQPNSNQAQGAAKAPVKKNPLLSYVGNWIGAFDNKPWILLTLNLSGEQFSGSLQRAKSFELSDNGEIKKVSAEFITNPLVEAKVNPDGLLITVRHADNQGTDRYMMQLSQDENTAEIRAVAMIMPPGMPKPKPWKVMKVK